MTTLHSFGQTLPQITVQAAASTATAISPASAGMGRPQRDVRRPHYPVESVTRGALDGRPAATGAAPTAVNDETALHQERLPFTVKVAGDRESLSAAISLRQAAYGRHVPELARNLNAPEPHDLAAGTVVLLAESKFDRQPLATMRIQTNQYEPLWLEQSVTLPGWLQGRNLAEATRLGTALGSAGRLAKAAIFKAYYLYCVAAGIDYMVIAGRSPLDRQYERLLFVDVFPDEGFIPMKHAGNIPHRVLAFDVATAEPRWREAKHPMYNFVFGTHHPDIDIGAHVHPPAALPQVAPYPVVQTAG